MEPVILIHGALGSKRELGLLRDCIESTTCIAIDLTGHGGGEIPQEGLSFDLFERDIHMALADAKLGRVHLVGYSMGGYAAMLFAARHPERVLSVTTLGTKYIWTPEGLEKELKKLDPDRMIEKVPEFAELLAAVHGPEHWRSLVKATADLMTRLSAEPLLTDEVLGGIACPALLCIGDGDNTAVPEDTLATARKLKDAGVLVLPRTRHPFDEVDLDLLVTQLSRFWEGAMVPSE